MESAITVKGRRQFQGHPEYLRLKPGDRSSSLCILMAAVLLRSSCGCVAWHPQIQGAGAGNYRGDDRGRC